MAGRVGLYEVAELERAKREMEGAEQEAKQVPEGWMEYDQAAAFFGVVPGTLTKWQQLGKLRRGRWRNLPDGTRQYLFREKDLERAKRRMEEEASRPVAEEGFIELHDAAEMLGVHLGRFSGWQREGWMSEGRVVPIPGTSARTKVWPREEVEALRERLREEAANFPPAGWVRMKGAARRAGVSVLTWEAVDGGGSGGQRAVGEEAVDAGRRAMQAVSRGGGGAGGGGVGAGPLVLP